MMHYDYEDLNWTRGGTGNDSGMERAIVHLTKDDTAWDPSSTKRRLYGPATVIYDRWPDGAINAYHQGT